MKKTKFKKNAQNITHKPETCLNSGEEAGLPDHVVRMYLEQSTDRLTGRMRNIVKNALRSAQPANQPTMSTGLDETPALIARQTKYSTLMTPSQRKAEAVN